ncbi:hypothetical protein D2E33_08295 [Mycobacteroides abscessus]|nr:hypothetical protein D2E33_08295 [Mycobacteroides abscessus]RIT66222.1 hypothetical protein D2E87_19425 [Mycobacteroides abscessus]
MLTRYPFSLRVRTSRCFSAKRLDFFGQRLLLILQVTNSGVELLLDALTLGLYLFLGMLLCAFTFLARETVSVTFPLYLPHIPFLLELPLRFTEFALLGMRLVKLAILRGEFGAQLRLVLAGTALLLLDLRFQSGDLIGCFGSGFLSGLLGLITCGTVN